MAGQAEGDGVSVRCEEHGVEWQTCAGWRHYALNSLEKLEYEIAVLKENWEEQRKDAASWRAEAEKAADRYFDLRMIVVEIESRLQHWPKDGMGTPRDGREHSGWCPACKLRQGLQAIEETV